MCMVLSSWQSHCKSSPGSSDECDKSAMWPPTFGPSRHPNWQLWYNIHHQSENCYSFYHLADGRRLFWPWWMVTYRDGLPAHRWSPIQVLTRRSTQNLFWLHQLLCSWCCGSPTALLISSNVIQVDQVSHVHVIRSVGFPFVFFFKSKNFSRTFTDSNINFQWFCLI